MRGMRQDGPLSGVLFIISCACLIASISLVSGVVCVKGFCCDVQVMVKGIRAINGVSRLVEKIEEASGLFIHRTESKLIPNREMTRVERHCLDKAWPGASVAV